MHNRVMLTYTTFVAIIMFYARENRKPLSTNSHQGDHEEICGLSHRIVGLVGWLATTEVLLDRFYYVIMFR